VWNVLLLLFLCVYISFSNHSNQNDDNPPPPEKAWQRIPRDMCCSKQLFFPNFVYMNRGSFLFLVWNANKHTHRDIHSHIFQTTLPPPTNEKKNIQPQHTRRCCHVFVPPQHTHKHTHTLIMMYVCMNVLRKHSSVSFHKGSFECSLFIRVFLDYIECIHSKAKDQKGCNENRGFDKMVFIVLDNLGFFVFSGS